MLRVLVTGADGKQAGSLIPILEAEGFEVVTWGRRIRLTDSDSVAAAIVRTLEGKPPIDAIVHLAGAHAEGSSVEIFGRMYSANVLSLATVVNELYFAGRIAPLSTVVAIGHPFDMDSQAHESLAYYNAKEKLKEYAYKLPSLYPQEFAYVSVIEPAGAIDTEEKRDDLSFRIVDAISAPIRAEQLDKLDTETQYECHPPKCYPGE